MPLDEDIKLRVWTLQKLRKGYSIETVGKMKKGTSTNQFRFAKITYKDKQSSKRLNTLVLRDNISYQC